MTLTQYLESQEDQDMTRLSTSLELKRREEMKFFFFFLPSNEEEEGFI